VFKGRPGAKDASGFGDRVERLFEDLLPPLVNRQVKRVRRRIGL
jgi:hypothetical protein